MKKSFPAGSFSGLLKSDRKALYGKGYRWLSIILTAAFLNLTCGCYYFKINTSSTPSAESVSALNGAGKTIIMHYNEKKWVLNDVDVKDDKLTGRISEYKYPPVTHPLNPGQPIRYTKRVTYDQRYLLNEVHLYVNEYSDSGGGTVSIPIQSISRLDVYDKDTATTVGSWFLASLGIIAGFYALLAILVIIFKESCPFIYTWNGEEFVFAGEIYSGSIHKPLERHDYLKLPTYTGQSYRIKITNEVKEIQHTNLMELLVVDHPKTMKVLIDKYGRIKTLSQLISPVKAVNLRGEDVESRIAVQDDHFYQSILTGDPEPLKDGIILEFPNRDYARSAKIALRAKNSIILDYTMRKLNDLFGYAYSQFQKKQQHASAKELTDLSLTQGIPLSLYVERAGKWEFADFYNVAGPMVFKDDVLEIPLTGKEGDPLRLKLEYGNQLWEIDYVAADYSVNGMVTSYVIPVSAAFDENRKDISVLLQKDDRKYYDQPGYANQAEVTFDLPVMTAESRSLFLHSKGWYQVVQEPRGKPDFAYLKTFRKPGVFNQFTNDLVKKLGTVGSNTK